MFLQSYILEDNNFHFFIAKMPLMVAESERDEQGNEYLQNENNHCPHWDIFIS